jgi:phosphoribosylamine--glycine ligase
MNVLILGGGGRESALARAFARSPQVDRIVVSPGNSGLLDSRSGIAGRVECTSFPTLLSMVNFIRDEWFDLVFVGPEKPLSEGVADELRARGIPVVGPSKTAARLETSKAYAKELCREAGVPTADYQVFTDYSEAEAYLDHASFPIVIKADGLAEGKGVVIPPNREEAIDALHAMMCDGAFGGSGSQVVIEEFMTGWETSLFALTDGTDFVTTVFSQDHKRIGDGDTGPNTGGMGAYAPVLSAEPYRREIEERIVAPVIRAMRERGCPYSGVLYVGLMITEKGPKVVEFNCRFGDPEAEVVLPLLKTDFALVCKAISESRLNEVILEWSDDFAVTVTAASAGYPGVVTKGIPIVFDASLQVSEQLWIDFAGVRTGENGLETNGGRVMMVTVLEKNLKNALDTVYQALNGVHYEGKQFRTDIGQKALHS